MSREDIQISDGQMLVLLNATGDPDTLTQELRSLAIALHYPRLQGHGWIAAMTREDIKTALTILEANQRDNRSPAGSMYLRVFVRNNPAVQQIYEACKTKES